MNSDAGISPAPHSAYGPGVLLLYGPDDPSGQMRHLAYGLSEAGYAVHSLHLPAPGDADWRALWADVRLQYCLMKRECSSLAVAGQLTGGVLALLLAEEYPLDAVISISAPLYRPVSRACGLAHMTARARRNLFAVAAPILAIHLEGERPDRRSLRAIDRCVSSAVKQALMLPPGGQPELLLSDTCAFLNRHISET